MTTPTRLLLAARPGRAPARRRPRRPGRPPEPRKALPTAERTSETMQQTILKLSKCPIWGSGSQPIRIARIPSLKSSRVPGKDNLRPPFARGKPPLKRKNQLGRSPRSSRFSLCESGAVSGQSALPAQYPPLCSLADLMHGSSLAHPHPSTTMSRHVMPCTMRYEPCTMLRAPCTMGHATVRYGRVG